MWKIEYTKDSVNDIEKLDKSKITIVIKAIKKVSQNPLPQSEGGYGKPLGNRNSSKLCGYMKIKLLKIGIRIVYKIIREKTTMRIIIVSARADNEVHLNAEKRIKQK